MEPRAMCVILNYDNIPGIDRRFPDAVIRANIGGRWVPDMMADTVYMLRKPDMSREDMCRMAKKAAPLAKTVIIEGLAADPSHDTRISSHRLYAAMC